MTLVEEIRRCAKCDITFHKPLVLGDIENNRFVFLSEEPTRDARDKDFFEYYLGPPKERFHSEWMPKMGIDEEWLKNDVYITHVYKCCSEMRKPRRKKTCATCLNWLEKEKDYFRNGKIIITFGEWALKSLRPVDYNGEKIPEEVPMLGLKRIL